MIKLTNLKKSYTDPATGKPITIIDIPDFSLGDGIHAGLRGESGTGKTTLLHLISGMTTPDSGQIEVLGTELNRLSESERDRFRANHIGYVFQSFNLLDAFTALENVMLGMMFADKGTNRAKAEKLLSTVGLHDRMHYKPSQLSVGQQQRVCIARAVANDPEILLADEPTGSLDPKTSREVLDLLIKISENKMLLVVSHEENVLNRFPEKMDLTEINKTAVA